MLLCYKYVTPTGFVNSKRNEYRIYETDCTGVSHTPPKRCQYGVVERDSERSRRICLIKIQRDCHSASKMRNLFFGDMLDKHVAPLGLYVDKCFFATNMPPLWGCTLVNASLLQICHPYGVCKFKAECISNY